MHESGLQMNASAPAAERKRKQRGFTLVELLVVLVILGLIATLVAPRVIKFIAGAKSDTAKVQIERLSSTLELYRLEVGRYPAEEAFFLGHILEMIEGAVGSEVAKDWASARRLQLEEARLLYIAHQVDYLVRKCF